MQALCALIMLHDAKFELMLPVCIVMCRAIPMPFTAG